MYINKTENKKEMTAIKEINKEINFEFLIFFYKSRISRGFVLLPRLVNTGKGGKSSFEESLGGEGGFRDDWDA